MSAAAVPMGDPQPMGACVKCGEVHDPKLCPGHSKRTGKPCGKHRGQGTNHVGYGLCSSHTGNTPNGEAAALDELRRVHLRIVYLADPAVSAIAEIMEDHSQPVMVRLRAACDLADRAGLAGKQVHEHTGPDGGPISVEVRQAQLLDRAKALRAGRVIEAPGAVNGHTNGSKV